MQPKLTPVATSPPQPFSMSVNPPAEITLAICTRNRGSRLSACLRHALAQRCDIPWDVVVVDSASTDDTPSVLAAWQKEFPDRLRVIRLERPGTGRARVAAAESTNANLLAFTDDDCYAEADYLEQIVEAFSGCSDLGAIGGRILLHDPADYPITICESMVEATIPPRGIVPAGFIQGASMAFRRKALRDAGGFDSRLGPGTPFCNEDVDIAGRINAAGWRVSYLPGPTVRHHHGRRSPDDVANLVKTYDLGRGAYLAKMIASGNLRYLRYWAGRAKAQELGTTLRELQGAAHFLAVASVQKDEAKVR